MSNLAVRALKPLVPFVRYAWRRAPPRWLATRRARRIGAFFYQHYVRDSHRNQTHHTWFLRNIPQLQLLNEVVSNHRRGHELRIASVGCSVGAELYSTVWLLRRLHPELKLVACGIDISQEVVDVARKGVYRLRTPSSPLAPLEHGRSQALAALPAALSDIMEASAQGDFRVRDWVREGISWSVADARNPSIAEVIGPQDVLMACNLLGPMDDAAAEACLGNLVRLIAPGGYLVLDGIDLDLKSRLTQALGLTPVTRYVEQIHTADPSKGDWPWTRWSHEPIDYQRADWEYRYSTVFAVTPIDEHRCHDAPLADLPLQRTGTAGNDLAVA